MQAIRVVLTTIHMNRCVGLSRRTNAACGVVVCMCMCVCVWGGGEAGDIYESLKCADVISNSRQLLLAYVRQYHIELGRSTH